MERSDPSKSALNEAAESESETPPGREVAARSDELFWSLPQTPVSLPREGPPAMSPRARRKARELHVPLQVLPIPAPGRRITEADVLTAAEALQTRPAETATAIRYPALREPLSAAEAERARAWSYSQHCIPQLSLETLLPCAAVLSGIKKLDLAEAPGIADLLLRAMAQSLCEERFRGFRALIDGPDRVIRGAIDLGYAPLTLPSDARIVVRAADRLSLSALVQQRRDALGASSGGNKESGTPDSLMSVVDYSATGIFSGNERVWPGNSAVVAVYDAQPHPILRPGRSLEIQAAWKIALTVDQRLIDRATATEFLQILMRRIEQMHCLL